MLQALKILVKDPLNVVFVISGRDQIDLDNWLGDIVGLGLSAEHGSFIKYPGKKWINLAKEIDFGWKKQVAEIFNYYEERTQGVIYFNIEVVLQNIRFVQLHGIIDYQTPLTVFSKPKSVTTISKTLFFPSYQLRY
jgi:hypothetical protein